MSTGDNVTDEHKEITETYYKSRGCLQKRRWVLRSEAKKEAKRASLRYKSGRISAYRCYYCSGFHIGHDKYAEPA